MKFSRWVDRHSPKHSYTFSISKTVSNFHIRIGKHSFNWWWPVTSLHYNLNRIPWRRIIFYCKARPYLCWLKGHDFLFNCLEGFSEIPHRGYSPRDRYRWCGKVRG